MNERRSGEEDAIRLERTWGRPAGLTGWITTVDHKELGLRIVKTAFTFFALAGVLAFLMRLQLMRPGSHLLGPDTYNQFFSTHGTAMMFLFAVPVMLGMGIYLVPLMVGTRNVAFPRLLNYGYWLYLFSGLLLFGGLLLNTGPDVGWFAYVPLSGPEYGPGKRVDVWSQMVTLMEISSLIMAVEIIVTVLKQRAPGMSLDRIPLFVWSQVTSSFMVIFAMPSVMIGSTLLAMDRLTNVNTQIYNHAEGGDPILWQHFFWFFAHPEVYIIFLPALGFISAILPAFTRRPVFGYPAIVLSTVATGFLAFGVWVHHMFATPLPDMGQGFFTASSLMITIPTATQIFCWIATLWTGRLRIRSPMLFVLAFFAVFLIGGLTGVMLGSVAIDSQVHDTFFVVAHLHYVLIGGSVLPLLGALLFWFPKWTGRMPSERLAWISFVLIFLGFNATFFPMHQLGLDGMPRRVYTYAPEMGWGGLNLLATAGSWVLALGLLVFLGNLIWSRSRGRVAGGDPWGGEGLEWMTPSPPPSYGHLHPPAVRGRSPKWERSPDDPLVVGLSTDAREVLMTRIHDATPDHRHRVSHASVWSFVAAVITGATFTGVIFHPTAAVVGLVLLGAALAMWFWPSREPSPLPAPLAPQGPGVLAEGAE